MNDKNILVERLQQDAINKLNEIGVNMSDKAIDIVDDFVTAIANECEKLKEQ